MLKSIEVLPHPKESLVDCPELLSLRMCLSKSISVCVGHSSLVCLSDLKEQHWVLPIGLLAEEMLPWHSRNSTGVNSIIDGWIPFSCPSLGSWYFSRWLAVTQRWLTGALEQSRTMVNVIRTIGVAMRSFVTKHTKKEEKVAEVSSKWHFYDSFKWDLKLCKHKCTLQWFHWFLPFAFSGGFSVLFFALFSLYFQGM